MKNKPITLLLLLALPLSMACEKPGHPCADGPQLEALTLPATFHVSRNHTWLGAVLIGVDAKPTFQPAPGAPAEELKRFQEDFDEGTKGEDVSVKFETMRGDTHYMCGATFKKGTPEYPAAFKRYLYDQYYDITDAAPGP
jgi:hypothetical protein